MSKIDRMAAKERRLKQVARVFARWAGCSLSTVVVRDYVGSGRRQMYEATDAATCARMVYDGSGKRLRQGL